MHMFANIQCLALATLFLATGTHGAGAKESPADTSFSVLSYNINALPSPLKRHKKPLLKRIAQILQQRRDEGTQPAVVVLQEAFDKDSEIIMRETGYKYVLKGPGRKSGLKRSQSSWDVQGANSYTHSAKPQKLTSSGMYILSDYEITNPVFYSFDNSACAGIDCLANKAIIAVELTIPGYTQKLQLVTTHLNSNKSAKVPKALRRAAHKKQTDILSHFLDKTTRTDWPLIMAGDFNTGQPARYTYFKKKIKAHDAGEICLATPQVCTLGHGTRAAEIVGNDDTQLFRSAVLHSSQDVYLTPRKISRNFREKIDGRPLSDHLGYEVRYALKKAPTSTSLHASRP